MGWLVRRKIITRDATIQTEQPFNQRHEVMPMAKISMHITVETEERSDRWACRSPDFGFTVYGATREEARKEVNNAVSALLGSFHGDLAGIRRFLEKRQVLNYNILLDDQSMTAHETGLAASHSHNCKAAHCEHPATEVTFEEVLIAT